jgi:monoamine oxidase
VRRGYVRNDVTAVMSRRELFRLIGTAGGSAAMYHAMAQLGYTKESAYTGPLRLEGHGQGRSITILGAGLAGMTAALELRNAGYKVRILEYNGRAGGRNWSIRGGDTITELGGYTQHCRFDEGLYFNPGPWRIPHHHHALIDYCKRLKVPLEPFTQVNYNSYVHASGAFGGKPRRYREVEADFNGHVAELLAKATSQSKLDERVSREDKEILLEALRDWGALNANYEYSECLTSSERRGYAVPPGGGLQASAVPSEPMPMRELLHSRLWSAVALGHDYDLQSTLFQPVGGMGRIGEAFSRELGDGIEYNCKVTAIQQDERGVTVTCEDARTGRNPRTVRADWCICTLPVSILGQIPLNVGTPMRTAIDALSYHASFKAGLQFKRRFWEEDDGIYGGISYTDQSITLIGYPNTGYFATAKGVLLGAYAFRVPAFELTALSPDERMKLVVEQGSRIHPQYRAEFDSGVSVGWHRIPWSMGCYAAWTDELREKHYDDLCAIDGRIVLAGEHVSQLPAWMEGSLLSALDAVERLHRRVMNA